MMLAPAEKRAAHIIDVCGLITVASIFLMWCAKDMSYSVRERAAAFAAMALMAGVCLRFVPRWVAFWGVSYSEPKRVETNTPAWVLPFVAAFAAALCFAALWAVYLIRDTGESFAQALPFWKCLDSGHYLAIAEDWYLSDGSRDRLVQLVFLPGYPLVIRLFYLFTRDWLTAGLVSSAVCFAAGCGVLYKLLSLDLGWRGALRAVVFLWLMPGTFFFAAPMSESLFLLLCAGTLLCARRGRWYSACLIGAYAAFTRSLGLTLFVPLAFELVRNVRIKGKRELRYAPALLLIPLGFAAYLLVNYQVSGDAFRFLEYQKEHWGQSLGLFFNTSAYQLREAAASYEANRHNFLGLWLPNLVSCFFALGVMLLAAKKLRPGYTAWFIAYYVIAIGATWLLSAPRYLLTLIPIPAALAQLAEKKRGIAITALLLVPSSAYYLAAFALRWQVW